jgi:hypothetical protein
VCDVTKGRRINQSLRTGARPRGFGVEGVDISNHEKADQAIKIDDTYCYRIFFRVRWDGGVGGRVPGDGCHTWSVGWGEEAEG